VAAKKCFDCHKEEKRAFSSRAFQHEPAKNEDCETCHKRHGFAQQLVLHETTMELCYGCHEDVRERFSSGNVHFPVSDGKCWDCHDPHSSDKEGLLRSGPEEVDDPGSCLVCHKSEIDPLLTTTHVHTPFKELKCLTCHNAHSSEHDGLLKDTPNLLCGSCHDTSADSFQNIHAELSIRGLDCSDCHTGHGSDSPALLSSRSHPPFAEGDCEICHSLPDEQGQVAFEENTTLADICSTCHDGLYDRLDLTHPHAAVDADNCMDCHRPHSSRFDNLLISPEADLCLDCHDDVLSASGMTPHLPVVLGSCGSCHEVHGSKNPGLLKTTGVEMCLNCHSDFEEKKEHAASVHAAIDDCLACHQPHEGKGAGLLSDEASAICAACHEVDEEAKAAMSGHQPYLSSNCLGCHEPHFSDQEHLVRETGSDLCLACHPDINHRLNMSTSHPPAVDDCLSCHQPHYSDELNLLASHEQEMCIACHEPEDIQLTEAEVHTPARTGDCVGCHNPHGSLLDKLITGRTRMATVDGQLVSLVPKLTERNSDLCYTCHDDLAEKFRQQGTHQPVMEGNCDACHASHGSPNTAFIRKPAPELCADCHQIDEELNQSHGGYSLANADCLTCHNPHTSDQPKLIRATAHPPYEDGDCDICHEPGADRKPELVDEMTALCAACHESVEERQDWTHQHAPFEGGECTACHNVHVADQDHLLRRSPEKLCTTCHEEIHQELQKSAVHDPFAKGQCLDCHRPHASQFTALTKKGPGALCLSCHTDLKEELDRGEPHKPAAGGDCTACHDAHSADNPAMLVAEKEQLCGKCHDLSSPPTVAAHSDFDMAGTDCQNCHLAHAGVKGTQGLLLPNMHPPYESGECSDCHSEKSGHALIESPRELCLSCHEDFSARLNKPVVHPPVKDDSGCVLCHGPHVGFGSSLQKQPGVKMCLTCHTGTEFSGSQQHEVAFEDCGTCHQPHSSEYSDLLDTRDILQLCLDCHDEATESHYHPMGDVAIDPRTKQGIDCVSCHSPHSSDHSPLLIAEKNRKLCILCHDLAH